MKTKKILCLFDYKARTGFGTVSENIVKEVRRHFGKEIKLDIVAINYFGESYQESDEVFVTSARNNDVNDDPFGRFFFLKVLKESNEYDGVFIMQDIGIIVPFVEVMEHIKAEKKEHNRKNFKTIFYFPIDCKIIPQITENLPFFDTLVTYTEFGRKEVLRHKPELKTKIKVVPHGNNPKDFYPIDPKEAQDFRAEYFGENKGKFIITNVNRNQPRKDLISTIFGFIEAKKIWEEDLPQPFLYLHCHPQDPLGWDLRAVFMQTDLVEDVDYKLLPKQYEDTMVEIDMVNKILNASDAFITTTLGEGWGLCLHPSSMVLTSNGCVQIKDVKVADKVMTNSQKFESVLDTTCRKVSSYIEVKTKYGFVVKATHEHPYFSLRNGKQDWRKIDKLKAGDYLAIVKPEGKPLPSKIDLTNYLQQSKGWHFDEKHIYNKYGYSPHSKQWSLSSICKKYDVTKSIAEDAIAYITGKYDKVSEPCYRLANQLIADGFDKPQPLKVNRFVELCDDLLYVFGWYLAEGSCEGGKRLEFSMGKDEVDEANKIAKTISTKFGVKDVIVRVFKNKCAVRVSSVALGNIFKTLFGNGAYNKRIPEILFQSPKSLMPLVNGYIKGDGHIKLSNDTIKFTTVSPSLAYQVQSVLASNGIMLSIFERKESKIGNYRQYNCGIPLHHLRKYMDAVGMEGVLDRDNKRNHRPDFIETDSHFFVPIIDIKEIQEETEVYDLCVENSHSFVANGVVCHNTITEAMATKTPVICSYNTSLMEMTEYGKNAYVLETMYPYCNNIDNAVREQVDIYEVAEKMLEVARAKYGNYPEEKKALLEKIERSYAWVSKLTWDKVCKSWIEYFKTY